MSTSIKTILAGLGLSLAAVVFQPATANAYQGDHCREYTRTVYIGNRAQEAYGTACLQPDGSWMIVGEGLGRDIPSNVTDVNYVIHDYRRQVVPNRVVYYNTHPRYNRSHYRTQPAFVWTHGGMYRDGIQISYTKNNYKYRNDRHDRHDRYDRRDRHDHGHGHGRGRGRD